MANPLKKKIIIGSVRSWISLSFALQQYLQEKGEKFSRTISIELPARHMTHFFQWDFCDLRFINKWRNSYLDVLYIVLFSSSNLFYSQLQSDTLHCMNILSFLEFWGYIGYGEIARLYV